MSNINAIKRAVYEGHIIDLCPYDIKYAEDIIRIRNQARAKYFLSQDFNLTKEQQLSWIQEDLKRENEAGFVAINKKAKL